MKDPDMTVYVIVVSWERGEGGVPIACMEDGQDAQNLVEMIEEGEPTKHIQIVGCSYYGKTV